MPIMSTQQAISNLVQPHCLAALNQNDSPQDLSELVEHLLAHHHPYTKTALKNLGPLLEKVVRVHGAEHSELYQLQALFNELNGDLPMHLLKEEVILFPYILTLASANKRPVAHFGSVTNPIQMMSKEHQTDGEILEKILKVTDNFTLPAGACASYRALYSELQAFVNDLFQHIYLENNFLFPQAIARENELCLATNSSAQT
jgi:regulator of cell morphogenesis and NO signaling